MTDISANNKRIAKNTLFLYFRMLIVMPVSIYTSRVILQTLGIEDFGIYNVVGGIVAMLGVLNGALSSSTSRFLTYELGRNDMVALKKTFSSSLNLHIVVAIIVVLFAETVGLWFFYNKLVIPVERMDAAFWVYQFSVFTTVFTFTQVPYNASLISHENMSIYAYIGLYDAFSKLAIVYVIAVSPFDTLIFYALLLMLNTILIQIFYRYYTYSKYEECRFRLEKDRDLYKKLLTYSGWEMFGGMATICQGQGINILLNLFFGPVVNAARAIAYQIQNSVNQFIVNFLMATRPQVIKNHAKGDYDSMYDLTFKAAKYSYFLMLALVLPIAFELHFILNIWLGDVCPEDTYLFTLIILVLALTEIFHYALIMPFHAIGKMKLGNSLNGTIMILTLPVSYFLLKMGAPAYAVFIVQLVTNVIVTCNGWLILRHYVWFSVSGFAKNILWRCFIVTIFAVITPTLITFYVEDGWGRFFLLGFTTEIFLVMIIYQLGINSNERKKIVQVVKEQLSKYRI